MNPKSVAYPTFLIIPSTSEVWSKFSACISASYAQSGKILTFCNASPVPFVIQSKVEAEDQHLKDSGIISKINWSTWNITIVPVMKKNTVSISVVTPRLPLNQHYMQIGILYLEYTIYLPSLLVASFSPRPT